MIHFGFSYVGLLYLIMLFTPNIFWAKYQPEGYEEVAKKENKFLQILERFGEIMNTMLVLIFADFNPRKTYWSIWLVVSFLCMLLYEAYWIRYFKSERTLKDQYSSICKIPVAGATLPVIAFLLLGIYGNNILLIVSTVLLGIGHIGIHLNHYKEIGIEKKKTFWLWKLCKGICLTVLCICLLVISVIIGIRNVRGISGLKNMVHGVDESCYVTLGNQEQYVLIRGRELSNPVIIYLHGGPSSPDAYCTYAFEEELVSDYTIISWDQRGCGRTYFKNQKTDPNNETATMEQALIDLDELVDYAKERFSQEKVIIMGWSYGSLLGSKYAKLHPEKVSTYIGVGQVVSLSEANTYTFEKAKKIAEEKGDDTTALVEAYNNYIEKDNISAIARLRGKIFAYLPAALPGNETMLSVLSPYYGIDDYRWLLIQAADLDAYYELNKELYDYTFHKNNREDGMEYEMPVYFISGSRDWVCPPEMVEDYMNELSAPDKDIIYMEDCGHSPHYTFPDEFGKNVKELLEKIK